MPVEQTISIAIIVVTAVLSRLPFLRFPIDDDFSIYTYIPRFAHKGFKWGKDLFLIGHPLWRMHLMDRVYGNPENGILRTRLFFMLAHVTASIALFYAVLSLTNNLWAAFPCGLLYSFYGSSPDFTAGNYSFEQLYIPFIFIGLSLLPQGPETIAYAGIAFGLASVAKWSSGSYAGALAGAVAWQYGYAPALTFSLSAAVPIVSAILVDWMLGYMDTEGKKQGLTRLATTLRLTQTKKIYFNRAHETLKIMGQTLPVWVIGIPAILTAFSDQHRVWVIPFTGVTLLMLVLQRGFSRYHYHPLIALLSLGTGLGIDRLLNHNENLSAFFFGVLFLALAGNLNYMLPLYIRPLDIKNLSQHEKYDQYIYIPYLAKILKRLTRMRGESQQRIFVWGTFSQLYHLTGLPASDKYLHHTVGPWDTQDLEPYFDTVIGGLIQHKPIYLIKTFHDLDMAQLERITGLKYQLIKVVLVRFPVYRLASYNKPAIDPLALPWQEKLRLLQTLTENPKHLDPKYLKKTDCEGKHVPGINKTDLKQGRLQVALKECKKLCALNPYDKQGLFFLGKLYDWNDQPERSAETFQQLLKLDPNHPHVRLIMAKQKIIQTSLEEAEILIKDDIRLFGKREETDFYHGLICQQRKQYQEAANYFENIIKTIPDWVDVQIRLGDCLVEMENNDQAFRVYDQAFSSIGEDKPDKDWLRGQAASGAAKSLFSSRPISQTLETYYQRDPKNIIIAFRLAMSLHEEGKTLKARSLFETFSERFKNFTENTPEKLSLGNHYFHLGEIHTNAGHLTRALTCFEHAVRVRPQWKEARHCLANTLLSIGDDATALHHYNLLFEISSKHDDADWFCTQAALGVAKLNSPKYPASVTLKKYLERQPENEILAYALASTLEKEDLVSEARSLFGQYTLSFKQKHLRANAWFRLARLSPIETQKPLLLECLKLSPDHAGALKLMDEAEHKTQLV